MIANLRGTHGSGKSTVVRTLLERYDAKPTTLTRNKPDNYVLVLGNGEPLYIVGNYVNACGGCDAIQPYSLIWPRVVEFAKHGHVLFEGALISTTYGSIGVASEEYGDSFVFAFLDTPLQVCLDRIKQRREAKGNMKPLDPKNTESKFNTINKLATVSLPQKGRRVAMLDYRKAVPQLLGLFYGK